MQKVSAQTRLTGAASGASGPDVQEDSAIATTNNPIAAGFMMTGYVVYGFQLSATCRGVSGTLATDVRLIKELGCVLPSDQTMQAST
jgi:hypothetical protein